MTVWLIQHYCPVLKATPGTSPGTPSMGYTRSLFLKIMNADSVHELHQTTWQPWSFPPLRTPYLPISHWPPPKSKSLTRVHIDDEVGIISIPYMFCNQRSAAELSREQTQIMRHFTLEKFLLRLAHLQLPRQWTLYAYELESFTKEIFPTYGNLVFIGSSVPWCTILTL